MTLSLTYSDLGTTIDKAKIEQNFTDIANKFNGGIDNSDIKSYAGIVASKFAAPKEYMTLSLYTEKALSGSAGDVFAVTPIPGKTGDQQNWKLVKAAWACTDTGAGTGKVDVVFGGFTAAGAWDGGNDVLLIDALTIAKAASASDNTYNGDNITFTAATVSFHSSEPRFFAMLLDTADSTTVSAADTFLNITLLLERDVQAAA